MYGVPSYGGYSGYYPGYYPTMPGSGQLNQPTQNQLPTQNQPGAQMANSGIIWVNDERAALEYPVAPGNAVVLWDNYAPVIYLKQADVSGRSTTQIYDLVERQTAPKQTAADKPVYTREEFDALAARVDDLAARLDAKETRRKTTTKEDQE